MITALAEAAAPSTGPDVLGIVQYISTASPALMLALFILALSKNWLMLPREINEYKAAAERERVETKADVDRERSENKSAFNVRIQGMQTDLDAARGNVADLTDTIIKQVVPAVTRVAGPLSELVELKRAQPRRRGQSND